VEELVAAIRAKKAELDRLRLRVPEGMSNLDHASDLELTYTSNAIEGNTLSAAETTIVIEQGITVAGKPLKDHLEAIDHYDAIRYVRELAHRAMPTAEMDIRGLHRLVVLRSRPDIGGNYADQGRYVLTDTGRHAFPSPAQIPALMGDFARWLRSAPATPEAAFRAHRELVDIHPFNDGNGRVARLLMNLILIRGDYPPVACALWIARITFCLCNQIRQVRAPGNSIGCFTSGSMRSWRKPWLPSETRFPRVEATRS
jgi:Fic family protein